MVDAVDAEDSCKVELQDNVVRVKVEFDSTFSPESLLVNSAVKLEEPRSEPKRNDDILVKLEEDDDDVEEESEEEEEEEENCSTSSKARKKKGPTFIFSMKIRSWFVETFTHSPEPLSSTPQEEIASEYAKAHPSSEPLAPFMIGRIVKEIWGKKVRCIRRRIDPRPYGSARRTEYLCLTKKKKTPDQAAKLSKSVFCLPISDLVTPGWTVEVFLSPFGIRYRKNIEQIYVDKQAVVLEVFFSLYEEHDDGIEEGIENSCDAISIGSSNRSLSSGLITIDPVRTLSANILCKGNVTSAQEFSIWDNKSVPTLGKVKTLLEVVGSTRICFGYNVDESWRCMSIGSECLNPNEKLVVIHKSFDDFLSNKGQRKLASTDCKILVTSLRAGCENCSHVFGVIKRREFRNQRFGKKNPREKCNSMMTRAELEEKLKRKMVELRNCKSRETYLRQKLSEVNGTNYEESSDSESSDDEEEISVKDELQSD